MCKPKKCRHISLFGIDSAVLHCECHEIQGLRIGYPSDADAATPLGPTWHMQTDERSWPNLRLPCPRFRASSAARLCLSALLTAVANAILAMLLRRHQGRISAILSIARRNGVPAINHYRAGVVLRSKAPTVNSPRAWSPRKRRPCLRASNRFSTPFRHT
jgi:hypothetical protein